MEKHPRNTRTSLLEGPTVSQHTKEMIFRQLKEMNAPTGSIVVMHSSLRSIGPVEGGAEALLDTLIEYFTRDNGLFCVPTHTAHNLRTERITLDMADDDNCLGAFPAVALRAAQGVRSENPILSMKVFGNSERAQEFIQGELYTTSATAPGGCYANLCDMNGYVLLAGVAHNRNTFLHAVGEILQLPNRMGTIPDPATIRRLNGEIVNRTVLPYYADFTNDVSARFGKYETAFRYHRCITDGFLGNAPAQLCDARKMAQTVKLIFQNDDGYDPMYGELPIPQKYYCGRELPSL